MERALTRDRWRLIDEAVGEPATKYNGSAAFAVAEAIRFLRSREPDA